MSRSTTVLLCVLLALATGAVGQDSGGADGADGSDGAVIPSGLDGVEGVEAELDWTLRGLDGATFPLERYRGRPLVLNMWATWCVPCVAELASLARLAESMAGSGVRFLIVSPESVDRVREFLRRHSYGLPAAVEDQRMPESFGLRALPTTYVLDRTGRVVLAHRGAADWNREEVRRFLLRLAR